MFTSAAAIQISDMDRTTLETLVRAGTTTQKVARRCRVILLAAQGLPNRAIARQVGVSRPTVLGVRAAFARGGVEGLRHDRKRVRSARKLTPALEQQLIDTTLHRKPAGATH